MFKKLEYKMKIFTDKVYIQKINNSFKDVII